MSDTDNETEKKTRFRSPPYPMFDLRKAVARAEELVRISHHHWVGVSVLADAWGMKSADGKVWRTVAALIQYGLTNSVGSGKTRKFQVTDAARRIIEDPDPSSPKRIKAQKGAALSPMIHKELWEKFGSAKGLSATVLSTYLTLDRKEDGESHYSEAAANDVIEIYRKTLIYAGLWDVDSEVENEFNAASEDVVTPSVVTVTEDKSSPGRPSLDPLCRPASFAGIKDATSDSVTLSREKAPITIQQIGGRLKITAEVDLDDIGRLREMLAKYQEILKMLK